MKINAYAFVALAIVATGGQAATEPATLSGIPLTVVKRMHQLPTPAPTQVDVSLSGVPMRTATLPAAANLPGVATAEPSAVPPSGVPMARATRSWASAQPAGGRSSGPR
jgi:hypothetical protein